MSGQGLGSGIGGTLGTALGVALAPETGGLSLAIPALGGAAGAGFGSALGGGSGKQDLMAALMGGIGGGLTGGFENGDIGSLLSGSSDATGAAGAAGAGASSGTGAASQASDFNSVMNGLDSSSGIAAVDPTVSMAGEPAAAGAASGGGSGGIGSWLGNSGNLKNAALAAGVGLPAIEGLVQQFTLPKYNVQGNANSVLSTSPGFNNPTLPQYTMKNTATPYSGNWYKYGFQPQQSMYNAMPIPVAQAQGGLIKGYAKGGTVRHYASGGGLPAAPMPGSPPLGAAPSPLPQAPNSPAMPAPSRPQPASNPLALNAAHKLGVEIGKRIGHHIKKTSPLFTGQGKVGGQGGGQDDAVPAKLSRGEFVIPADVVSQLGDGSSDAGGEALEGMVKHVRAEKTSNGSGFPAKAHNPLSYLHKKGNA